jgi:hypothetical protein
MQHTVTQILAEAATVAEATPKILRALREWLGWEVGALWRVDREAGRPMATSRHSRPLTAVPTSTARRTLRKIGWRRTKISASQPRLDGIRPAGVRLNSQISNPPLALLRKRRLWPHRLAVVLGCATFPLLFIGGLVTSKGAGLAVPDWPTTFGYNMFLYPWPEMVGNIFTSIATVWLPPVSAY